MRALPRRALSAAAPAAVLLFALTACGGSDSGSGDSAAVETQQSAQNAGGAQAAGEAEDADEKTGPPLTGDIKQKAEGGRGAGQVSGHGREVRGGHGEARHYAVEVKKADGMSVEVYLDKSCHVTGTKQEGTEETENGG